MFIRNRGHKAFVLLEFSYKLSENLHTARFLGYIPTVRFASGHFLFLGNSKQHCIINFSNVYFIGSCRTAVNLCTSIFILALLDLHYITRITYKTYQYLSIYVDFHKPSYFCQTEGQTCFFFLYIYMPLIFIFPFSGMLHKSSENGHPCLESGLG